MPKITAIITSYNVEEYIATAIQSVLDCGFDDLELIVVDDGSTDKTRMIVDRIAADLQPNTTFHPLYFSRNTIGGVATAANAGLDKASGDIILFVDGDDWVIPHNLREAINRLDDSHADFIVCDCQEYWNNNGRYSHYPEHTQWQSLAVTSQREAQRDILLHMAPFPWRKVYRRSFLERNEIRFPVGDFFFEDNPFHWETTTRAKDFLFYRKVTHVHRMDRSGQTVNAKGEKFIKIFDHATIIKEQLESAGAMDEHRAAYMDWLVRHVLWCSDHVPAGLLNRVFDLARTHLLQQPADLFWDQIAQSGIGIKELRKLTAIYLDKRFEFLREF